MSKNPCIDICKFADEICLGCGRSKREIKAWKKLDKAERHTVLAESAQRLQALKAKGRSKSR
ncbi:DUF1289 domain-containing protein [Aquipseudomonas guryensis]|uniref:DUF1289 domain-containing protein n=1 Tax=Aquipseudomonas guryensis TaxID=2759165 RepID=A0A7W4DAU4_9GAMM|nr:DUF1289 domain-containing protein [Pseudomonas guryensis]MBB1519182.1 DUF1289 domain-containing protein [Pseudomonas guryensis]